MRYKFFIIFIFFSICGGSVEQNVGDQNIDTNQTVASNENEIQSNEFVVASDFIPIGEIVWCKKNFGILKPLYKEADDEEDPTDILMLLFVKNTVYKDISDDEYEEIRELISYLQETVDYVAPVEFKGELSWRKLVLFDVGLDLSTEDNSENFDSILTSTAICTGWYNSFLNNFSPNK